jgi:hypothetical protein
MLGGAVPTWVIQAHHLSRVYQPDWQARSTFGGPLRVLVVVGCADDDAAVEPLDEIAEIRRGVQPVQRTIDLKIVRRPENLDALYGAITPFRPHVLHFIGHGEAGVLKMEGWQDDWKTERLVDFGKPIVKQWRPRLVFLNACRGATAARGLASVAGAFISNGALAVVAMQGNIQGKAAGRLAATFYSELARGSAVDEALSLARGKVAGVFAYREAAYPVLYLTRAPDRILPAIKREQELGDYQARIPYCPFLSKDMRTFVNQVDARRRLCSSTWPIDDESVVMPFLILRGGSGYGKSLLSAWLLDLSVRVGRTVRYVHVQPLRGGGVDAAGVLRSIRGTPEQVPGRTSPLMCHLRLDADGQLKLEDALVAARDPATMFEKFRIALRQAAAIAPISIVLDEIGKSMDTGSFRLLWTHLLDYLGTDELQGVTVVLVLTDDEYDYYVTQQGLPSLPEREVALGALGLDDFVEAFREYLEYRRDEPDPDDEYMLGMVRRNAHKWAPLTIGEIKSRVARIEESLGK